MPQLQVITKTAEQVWASPDGQRKIYKLVLEYEGKPVAAKTYSDAIGTPGWSGTVETYEKESRNGSETFVKQPPKEGGYSGGASGGNTTQRESGKPAYQAKDEKAIQAMWAIGQAVQVLTGPTKGTPMKGDVVGEIEATAQELFAMVARVKASEDAPEATPETDESQKEAVDKVFPVNEELNVKDLLDELEEVD